MVNKITKSERFIRELFINEEENLFVTQVDLTLGGHELAEMGLEKSYEDVDSVTTKKIDIKWNCELEYRSWGIKSIIVVVPDQDISFAYDKIIDDEGNTKEIEHTVKLANIKLGDSDYKFPIMPTELTWDKKLGFIVWFN